MKRPLIALAVLALVAMPGACASPSTRAETTMSPFAPPSAAEHAATIEALRPPKRARPVVAVLADNAGTETTDFVVPYGVLVQSGVADVTTVAPTAEPIQLMPALRVEPQATLAEFDIAHPTGADYVIVPAMHHRDAPAILAWIRAQAEGGATIVAICSGALVVAEAGLLDGRRATTHWFDVDRLVRNHPTVRRVDDRRYVADRGVVTTTGVTASVPVSLAMVEAIAGREHAARVAEEIGAPADWMASHDGDAFRLDARTVLAAAGRWLAFWRHEEIGFEVKPGVDEIALAFATDAYSRTDWSRAHTVADPEAPIRTRRGLLVWPDRGEDDANLDDRVVIDARSGPTTALDLALDGIAARYGASVADFVALQLEYPRPGVVRD